MSTDRLESLSRHPHRRRVGQRHARVDDAVVRSVGAQLLLLLFLLLLLLQQCCCCVGMLDEVSPEVNADLGAVVAVGR